MLCDIVEMSSCHILLGRPWNYDCRVVHDCVKDVYTIEKGGMKKYLIHLQDTKLGKRNLTFGH